MTQPQKQKKHWTVPYFGWSKRTRKNFLTGMLFISPWLIGFLAFSLYPMAASFVYSFTEYHAKRPLEWVGLQNYIELLHDDMFWTSLGNTLYMVLIAVPLELIVSFICAILLNLKVAGQSIYRVIYFLPSIVPVVAGTILWLWLLNPQVGLINTLLGSIGIDGPNWLADPRWSKPALLLLGLWGVGGTIMIYLSGLQDVPLTLLEAAELDGASWWQRVWHITVPMVSPITLFTLITGVIAMFQYFAQAYVFRGGGELGDPLRSTMFYSVYLFQKGFLFLKIGSASAMAWILFFIILGCTALLLKISGRYTYYAE